MHRLHYTAKNTPSLALNKYFKDFSFLFLLFFKNRPLNFSTLYSKAISKAFFMNEKNSITKR